MFELPTPVYSCSFVNGKPDPLDAVKWKPRTQEHYRARATFEAVEVFHQRQRTSFDDRRDAIRVMRAAGKAWSEIAKHYGITKQAAIAAVNLDKRNAYRRRTRIVKRHNRCGACGEVGHNARACVAK